MYEVDIMLQHNKYAINTQNEFGLYNSALNISKTTDKMLHGNQFKTVSLAKMISIFILYNKLWYKTSGVLDLKSTKIGPTHKETKRIDIITQPSF